MNICIMYLLTYLSCFYFCIYFIFNYLAAPGLSSWRGNSQLWHVGQFPDWGLNLDLLHWKHEALATGQPGKSHSYYFGKKKKNNYYVPNRWSINSCWIKKNDTIRVVLVFEICILRGETIVKLKSLLFSRSMAIERINGRNLLRYSA